MFFDRQDMRGVHYKWDTDVPAKKPVFSGEPSRRFFDRFNGEQVLFIINWYASQQDGITMEEGRIIEWEIQHHLPTDVRSEISVINWLAAAAQQRS